MFSISNSLNDKYVLLFLLHIFFIIAYKISSVIILSAKFMDFKSVKLPFSRQLINPLKLSSDKSMPEISNSTKLSSIF